MTDPRSLTELLNSLQAVGIPPPFARQTLPEWWDDAIAGNPSGLQQAKLLLARAFNLEPTSLFAPIVPKFRSADKRFKLSKNPLPTAVSVSANYATAIARIAIGALQSPIVASTVRNPLELRSALLHDRRVIDLEALVSYCWQAGIPVIHIKEFPDRKMAGLAVKVGQRFAIILGAKRPASYLLFHLAHEIGHIALGHLSDGDGFIADEKIELDTNQEEEEGANEYATILLNGSNTRYTAAAKRISAARLSDSARALGAEKQIDPGHIILNWANNVGEQAAYATATQALKSFPGFTNGHSAIDYHMQNLLDWESISDDQSSLIRQAAGIQRG